MRFLFVLALFVFPGIVLCQDFSIGEELQLANHLINSNNNEEAVYHLKKTLNKFSGNQQYTDTLNFLVGLAYYQEKQMLESSNYFLKVSNGSPSYNQARLTSIYNYLYEQNYQEADNVLTNLKTGNSLLFEYQTMQQAGLALLKKDYDLYPQLSKDFTYKYFQIEKEQTEMDSYYRDLLNFKPKSVALAGILSAVVPGTGKMYAGKLGEGMSALFIVSILGALTAENYLKSGVDDYKTITFGSLLGIFYLGNIYGSMVSVKVYREEFYKTYERKILLNLHIPLRNIYY